MEQWDEIRTVAAVVQFGTISGAAKALGIHRSTVVRHVDALEEALGAKLFQRHTSGYNPTELGLDVGRVAKTTTEQFRELTRRAQGLSQSLSGELIVTSGSILSAMVLPFLREIRRRHPALRLTYRSSWQVLRLEYGEAHVAFRSGPKPTDPDNVVRKFQTVTFGLYTTLRYAEENGLPQTLDELGEHQVIDIVHRREPGWLAVRERVPDGNCVLRTNDIRAAEHAVICGLGIGPLNKVDVEHFDHLVPVLPDVEWSINHWLVTHVDLHRTPKVQAFLRCVDDLKERAVRSRFERRALPAARETSTPAQG